MKYSVVEKAVAMVAIAICAFLFTGMAHADEEDHEEHEEHGHFDALVFQSGGQVQMGGIDVECFMGDGEPGCDPDGHAGKEDTVYEAELEETGTSPGLIGSAEEPGFFAVPSAGAGNLPAGGQPLPANSAQSFNLILAPNSPVAGASILFWDGTGAVSWGSVPNGEYFEVEGNSGTTGVLIGTGTLAGIPLDSTDGSGGFDTHPDFFLHGNSATTDPTAGFYALFGTTQIAGLQGSNPWSVVFDWGVEDEEQHELAVANVVGFIPEPATGVLVTLGLAGLSLHRRRGIANA